MDRHLPADPDSLSENDVRRILRLHDGVIWITTRAGLNLRDPATGHFRAFHHLPGKLDSIPSDNLWALAEDQSGRLWIATTDAGLAVLTGWTAEKQPIFKTIDTQMGLPSNSVLALTIGNDGRIWANTTAGLAAIRPDTLAVQVFSAGEGSAQHAAEAVRLGGSEGWESAVSGRGRTDCDRARAA